MSTPTEPNVQTIENAALDDVRPGDHITWEWTRTDLGITSVDRRECIAHQRDEEGVWLTKEGAWIWWGTVEGGTLTIRRPIQELPTKPGTVIVPADGREYIEAEVGGQTYHAREAILLGRDDWHAAWRSDTRVTIYATPDQITPGTWKVDDQ